MKTLNATQISLSRVAGNDRFISNIRNQAFGFQYLYGFWFNWELFVRKQPSAWDESHPNHLLLTTEAIATQQSLLQD